MMGIVRRLLGPSDEELDERMTAAAREAAEAVELAEAVDQRLDVVEERLNIYRTRLPA